jgi:hypothetical protein
MKALHTLFSQRNGVGTPLLATKPSICGAASARCVARTSKEKAVSATMPQTLRVIGYSLSFGQGGAPVTTAVGGPDHGGRTLRAPRRHA